MKFESKCLEIEKAAEMGCRKKSEKPVSQPGTGYMIRM